MAASGTTRDRHRALPNALDAAPAESACAGHACHAAGSRASPAVALGHQGERGKSREAGRQPQIELQVSGPRALPKRIDHHPDTEAPFGRAGSARLQRCEQDGNTRARAILSRPRRSRWILLDLVNDTAENTNCRVVLAGSGLQNHRAACRVAGGFDSRPPPPPPPARGQMKGNRTSRAESAVSHARLGRLGAARMPG